MSVDLDLSAVSSSFRFCLMCSSTSEVMIWFSGHHTRQCTLSVCSIIGDTNFDHLVKMVSARFLHHKVNLSFLASINDDSYLNQLLQNWLQYEEFFFPALSFLIYLLEDIQLCLIYLLSVCTHEFLFYSLGYIIHYCCYLFWWSHCLSSDLVPMFFFLLEL